MKSYDIVAHYNGSDIICLDCCKEDENDPEMEGDGFGPVFASELDFENDYCGLCCGLIADTL